MNSIFKIWNIKTAAAILAASSLVSCVDDLNPQLPQEQSHLTYEGERIPFDITISLKSVEGAPTRDDHFQNGNDEESTISNLLILFFDQKGNYITHFDSEDPKDSEENNEYVESIEWNAYIDLQVKVYKSILDKLDQSISDESEEKIKFHSFFAVVNYSEEIWDELMQSNGPDENGNPIFIGKNFYNINNDIRTQYYTEIDNKTRFIMTTPGHYDDEGNFSNLQLVGDNKVIYNKKLEKIKPLEVYVERLAARVDVELDLSTIQPIEVMYGTDIYSLKFKPVSWGLEGEEEEVYLQKQSGSNFDEDYPDNFFNWTNHYSGLRTFWAESPIFYSDGVHAAYPSLGNEIKERKDLPLKYFKFNEITDISNTTRCFTLNKTKYTGSDFTSEHTFPVSEFSLPNHRADNPYAVPTSLVVAGQYDITYYDTDEVPQEGDPHEKKEEPNQEEEEEGIVEVVNVSKTKGDPLSLNGAGFYIRFIDMSRTDKDAVDDKGHPASRQYQYRLYLENNDNGQYKNSEGEEVPRSAIKDDLYVAMLKEQYVIFTETNKVYEPVKLQTKYVVNGEIKYLADDIFSVVNTHTRYFNSDWINASNTFTLQLKDISEIISKLPKLYYGVYPGENKEDGMPEDYIEITSDNLSTVGPIINKMLQKQLGYAQLYYKGKAFFYAPVTHYYKTSGYKGLFRYNTESKKTDTDIETGDTETGNTETGNTETGNTETGNTETIYSLNHETGDFGIVRNHAYKFKINQISTLGYGIPDLDYIPLPEPRLGHEIYLFDIELEILPWQIFDYTIDIQ